METQDYPVLSTNMADWGVPGVWVELDPLQADAWGAFVEDALNEEEVIDSELDLEGVA
jgi:hypothetical protein